MAEPSIGRTFRFVLWACLFPSADAWSLFGSNHRTVRIFLVVGDDVMAGYASMPHLHDLATAADTAAQYAHWLNTTSQTTPSTRNGKQQQSFSWKVRSDVYVTYDRDSTKTWQHGPLTVKGCHGRTV
jgi:hypothetical protein